VILAVRPNYCSDGGDTPNQWPKFYQGACLNLPVQGDKSPIIMFMDAIFVDQEQYEKQLDIELK
jgi:hypothetical protein